METSLDPFGFSMLVIFQVNLGLIIRNIAKERRREARQTAEHLSQQIT